jgi:hypothetical protein
MVWGSNPSGGKIFRTCPDSPWGPPSLLYSGYWVFPGGKVQPGRDADPSPLSSAEVKNRVELYLYSPEEPLWPVKGWNLPTYITGTGNAYVHFFFRLLQNRRIYVIPARSLANPWIGFEDVETRGQNFKWCINCESGADILQWLYCNLYYISVDLFGLALHYWSSYLKMRVHIWR